MSGISYECRTIHIVHIKMKLSTTTRLCSPSTLGCSEPLIRIGQTYLKLVNKERYNTNKRRINIYSKFIILLILAGIITTKTETWINQTLKFAWKSNIRQYVYSSICRVFAYWTGSLGYILRPTGNYVQLHPDARIVCYSPKSHIWFTAYSTQIEAIN